MARIKVRARTPLNVLELLELEPGYVMQLVAIKPVSVLLVFNSAEEPNVDTDDCVPIVYGTQAVQTEPTDEGIWLYSENYAEVYCNVPMPSEEEDPVED
ncbi:hypothetical protein [Vibrio phage VCPH]|nr:hypothetical protein [Vibrio phage VCPH]